MAEVAVPVVVVEDLEEAEAAEEEEVALAVEAEVCSLDIPLTYDHNIIINTRSTQFHTCDTLFASEFT